MMPGTGTSHKSRPHTHGSGRCRGPECYRLEQTRSSSTHQDSYRNHHTAKQESYRNHRNQDSYRDRYTVAPHTIFIDTQPPHHPPRYVNTGANTYRDNHSTHHGAYRDHYRTDQDSVRSHQHTHPHHIDNQEPHYDYYDYKINQESCYTSKTQSPRQSHDIYRDHTKSNQDSLRNHSFSQHPYRYDHVTNQESHHDYNVTNHDQKTYPDSSRNHYAPNPHYYRDNQESQRDHYDPPRAIIIDTQPSRSSTRRYVNRLIPSSACGSCSWQDCCALICCVLTCGFYGHRQHCVPPNESSTDPPPKSEPEQRQFEAKPEPKGTNLPSSGSFRYPDVYFKGKKVNYPQNSEAPSRRNKTTAKDESQRPVSDTSTYLDVDDVDDGGGGGGTDIDSLITKKLLELYKMHQIEQLAKCTSDQSFSRKTNEISDLINSIAQDYNLEEQEAECRLVHGVIRISTRKYKHQGSKGKPQDALLQPNGRRDGTLPDSGNETMTFTFSNDEPEMLVSDSTPSDELARKMRKQSGRSAYSSGTATDFSGEPLLC